MNRMFLRGVMLVLLLGFAVSFPAVSQQPPAITEREIDRFITDWPEFVTWSEDRGSRLETEDLAGMYGALSYTTEMERYLSTRGWQAGRFFHIAASVSSALVSIEVAAQMPGMLQELEQQKSEIRDDPRLPPAQKEQLLAMIDMSMSQFAALHVDVGLPPADLQLITARHEALRQMFYE